MTDILTEAKQIVAQGPDITYPSRAAAGHVRKTVQALIDALEQKPRAKGIYIGAPACFALETACKQINDAYGNFGCYVVGSSLERPDWRDVDVRFIMADEAFAREFPDAGPIEHSRWEFDPKWLLLTVAISAHLSKATGLPVDFQIQPQSHANERHKKPRNAVGLRHAKSR